MRVIISGGGTGGHIYPALAIANRLARTVPKVQIMYVGTAGGLESDIVPREGIPFCAIRAGGLERSFSWRNLVSLWASIQGFAASFRIIRNFRPEIVIGTGGFVSGPVLLAARLQGIPTLIQEQNALPGITNRVLSRFVNKIALGFSAAAAGFPPAVQHKLVVTGNPVREEIIAANREDGRREFGLSSDKLTVLVAGGSRGARSINAAMLEVHKRFAGHPKVQILHATGTAGYDNYCHELAKAGIDIENSRNIIVKPYFYNMPAALAAADIVVFRAGAIGLAEIAVRGLPSILVPYPFAAENHQEVNARVMERAGAAIVILDKDLNGKSLARTLETLLNDPDRLAEMAAASRRLGVPDAASRLASLVENLVKTKR